MHPVFFHIGSRPIYWYGVMMALAFLAAMAHWRFLGRREGRDTAYCADLVFWTMVSGILGARVAYVLANLDYYMAQPAEIIRIDRGGLVYYGGFVGATLAVILYARLRKDNILATGDFTITGIPLGHALGRIGCFLNGCCYGKAGDHVWCVALRGMPELGGVPRHPVQIYEAALNLAVYVFLTLMYRRRRRNGEILALYLLTYPVVRFLMEFLRGDESIRWYGITAGQWDSLGLFLAGAGLWLWTRKAHETTPGHA